MPSTAAALASRITHHHPRERGVSHSLLLLIIINNIYRDYYCCPSCCCSCRRRGCCCWSWLNNPCFFHGLQWELLSSCGSSLDWEGRDKIGFPGVVLEWGLLPAVLVAKHCASVLEKGLMFPKWGGGSSPQNLKTNARAKRLEDSIEFPACLSSDTLIAEPQESQRVFSKAPLGFVLQATPPGCSACC